MKIASIITIDGPAASGKSTVAAMLAQELGYLHFDTGVMYRVVTRLALDRGIDVHDQDAVGALVEQVRIDVLPPTPAHTDGRQYTVLVEGQDLTWAIRTREVDQNVSVVSAQPRVRMALAAQQRRIGLAYGQGRGDKAGIIMVGRDIGTVILPEAALKIYLDASAQERAHRRHTEIVQRGEALSYEGVLADMERRDRLDSERAISPLRPAVGACIVDTTKLTPSQVVERIRACVCMVGSPKGG